MPLQRNVTASRWTNITTRLTATIDTLEILAHTFQNPVIEAITAETQSLVECVQTVQQNKVECTRLMEQTLELLNAIIIAYTKSDSIGELPPSASSQVARFTETLRKLRTFIEAQQNSSRIKTFFRQGEVSSALLRDCRKGLRQGLEFFHIDALDFMKDVTALRDDEDKRHQEVLNLIDNLSDVSDGASSISRIYAGSSTSSTSISLLPSEPTIFYGREDELSDTITHLNRGSPRVAILGAGGMGKTALARAIVHHPDIAAKYGQHRYFVVCDSTTSKVELAALIGAHLGLKPGKDLTHPVLNWFSKSPSSILVLDNLETVWEPVESRGEIEDFLSLLTQVDQLALVITMRGTERPAEVRWTRPFLRPLQPLKQQASRKVFVDITDAIPDSEEIDKLLSLTDNMPLAIQLLAHLADSEGSSNILSRWEEEKTSLISEGYDQRSNLDFSISLSLSSPRLKSEPDSQELLSLLSLLPDGLSDIELVQSKLPIKNILGCKTALIRTALVYSDDHKRLKVLVPIREYVQKCQPAADDLVRPLLKHYKELLGFFMEQGGTCSTSSTVAQISVNLSNIQNILRNILQQQHPDLKDSIYSICDLNHFSRCIGRGNIPLIAQVHAVLPQPSDHRLQAYFMTELFNSRQHNQTSNPDSSITQALHHFDHINDPDLKCRFYIGIANYYHETKHDLQVAMKFCQTAISLGMESGNMSRHSEALRHLAWIEWRLGNYPSCWVHAHEAGKLARISANFLMEAYALRMEAVCWTEFGNYQQSILLCNRARALLVHCGMSGGDLDHIIMTSQANIHRTKTEYVEACNIHCQILEQASKAQDHHQYVFALFNVAEIELSMGASEQKVQRRNDTVKALWSTTKYDSRLLHWCNVLQADLNLEAGDHLSARGLILKSLRMSWGQDSELVSYCLERLANSSRWNGSLCDHGQQCFSWATVFLAQSIKFKVKLGIHKAVQYVGDVFLSDSDEHTAVSLFTVALEGFTQMDIHQSRAECMLRLGDIFEQHGDLFTAVGHWKKARPLFERSSQAKQVGLVDKRLAGVRKDVREQYQRLFN